MHLARLALNLMLLAASLMPAAARAQEVDCQTILPPDAVGAISGQIKQLADELRQAQNSPPDSIVRGTDNATVAPARSPGT